MQGVRKMTLEAANKKLKSVTESMWNKEFKSPGDVMRSLGADRREIVHFVEEVIRAVEPRGDFWTYKELFIEMPVKGPGLDQSDAEWRADVLIQTTKFESFQRLKIALSEGRVSYHADYFLVIPTLRPGTDLLEALSASRMIPEEEVEPQNISCQIDGEMIADIQIHARLNCVRFFFR
jgi:hypothetical protein